MLTALINTENQINEYNICYCVREMTGDFPTLYKVFVSERDQYLARSLKLSAMPIEIHNADGGN